jgi:AcrR family transcriptional regulator
MRESSSTPVTGKRGRRRGGGNTSALVVEAAKRRFAADGYDATTIRSIAADAGVDSALVVRFFGSKSELFARVMHIPLEAPDALVRTLEQGPDDVGARLTRAYLQLWSDPSTAIPIQTAFRSAVTNEDAARQLRAFVNDRIVSHVAETFPDVPHAIVHVAAASTALLGIATGRFVIQAGPLASCEMEELVRVVAPAIEALLAPLYAGRSIEDGAAPPASVTAHGGPE